MNRSLYAASLLRWVDRENIWKSGPTATNPWKNAI